jgi:hypothetical protein
MRQHRAPVEAAAGCSSLRPCFLPDDLLQFVAESRALLLHRSLTSLSVQNIGIGWIDAVSHLGVLLANHYCQLSMNAVMSYVGFYLRYDVYF